MATDKLGLYVHIPYCVRKCNYCDFCSFPNSDGDVPEEYLDRLIDEIYSYKAQSRYRLSTIYFGGGTPSLLSPGQMGRIMQTVNDVFDISSSAEVTMEANPGTLDEEKASEYRKLGFNRISIGLQSIHDIEMKKLGRIHNFDEFLTSYNILRTAGFNNINVDLMYGIPHQTLDSFSKTLDTVVRLSPDHISCYGLIVEAGTPFYDERDTLPVPSSDTECDMYYMAAKKLYESGYSHYEISNYSKPGFESKHNMLYWNTDEYIGVGLSAHSYFKGKRSCNTSDIGVYLRQSGICHIEEVVPDNEDKRYEYAMLNLRLKEGFSLSEYQNLFGISFTEGKGDILSRFSDLGLIDVEDDRIRLTEKGFYVSNAILVEIL